MTSISPRLRRSYKGRCWAYSGARERFARARCGHGSFFKVASGGDSFSYLLPARAAAGPLRARHRRPPTPPAISTTLARGSSRIVFYVK